MNTITDRARKVIMLIDYDNLQICASRDAPGQELDLHAIVELAQSYGTVVVARAYAEWNMAMERLSVYKAGLEPVFAPVMRADARGRVEGKSLADTVMVADGVDLLWQLSPDVLVLVTSDKDMIPLARIARQRGTSVVVVGSDLTAVQLVEMCNVLITYRQLIKDFGKGALGAAETETPTRRERVRPSTGSGQMERAPAARHPRVSRASVAGESRELPEAAAAAPESAPEATVTETAPSGDAGPATSPARRRRRRGRGRSRSDDASSADGSIEVGASEGPDSNGRQLDSVAEYQPTPAPIDLLVNAPTTELEPRTIDGAADDGRPPSDGSEAEPQVAAARPTRRRRRPTRTSETATADGGEPRVDD